MQAAATIAAKTPAHLHAKLQGLSSSVAMSFPSAIFTPLSLTNNFDVLKPLVQVKVTSLYTYPL